MKSPIFVNNVSLVMSSFCKLANMMTLRSLVFPTYGLSPESRFLYMRAFSVAIVDDISVDDISS